MVVQQHVLNWLYSVLTSEYHDVNRTYNDVAQALSQYPTLSPKTDVHTYTNGSSALLLHLSGTIPVVFRGATYRFPLSIWIPHAYPREAPLVYVSPTDSMVVRPGQHVDLQGQVYHPYLAGWSTFWDKSSLLDFLAILRDVFAKEPPLIARQQAPPFLEQISTPLPRSRLQPDLATRPASTVLSPAPSIAPRPPLPPPPPKPGAVQSSQYPASPSPTQNGPPLPPPPPGTCQPISRCGPTGLPQYQASQQRAGPSRYDSAPPLPLESWPLQQSPPTTQIRPFSLQNSSQNLASLTGSPHQCFSAVPRRMSTISQAPAHISAQQQWPWAQLQPVLPQPQPRAKPPPPRDLMSDDLILTIPSLSDISAPPIPPNPEKDALLCQLAQTLHAARQAARAQNESSLFGLQAQRRAMLNALSAIQADSAALTQLSSLLSANQAALKDSLRRADLVIQSSARQPAPAIDDLLVAQTVVGNQLYEIVAEERAMADAAFVLGRSAERGRMAPETLARVTRGMAREWYLKKALVKKIGRGLGLT